jgi:hypothetical protein
LANSLKKGPEAVLWKFQRPPGRKESATGVCAIACTPFPVGH